MTHDDAMLLKHLYRISLEEPPYWCFFIGVGRETDNMLEGLRTVWRGPEATAFFT
ncbi:hypothetical protein NR800_35130 [Corallococcus interemptor]|uniref:hypothetical protein n=1 Tax=Corallococcus TaxID=83461 RepID=UPI001CBD7E81|nr:MULTISPECIES: hypothetical protein [unclassified Corallococcus]MBZ4332502.1 hypothetical protein [Corallococcus sp. AS-1-12]MBZ4376256.1 hypothetical protein [Corallococcus sp. AS-1-6]